jgi:type VI secretion system protein ImpG
MSEKKYFEREYNFLQIAGEEFAKKHQAIGGLLRLSERQRKDPFVERLFEAFAFLSGRIHERLDDDMPEFTGGLMEQLFPQFLRHFPSCAILKAETMSGAVTKPVVVKRGSEIQTPTGRYKIKYRVSASPLEQTRTIEKTEPAEFVFRTAWDFVVHPVRLKKVRLEDTPEGQSALVLQFQPERNVKYEDLDLKRLTLYLHGPFSLTYTLLAYLTRHAVSIGVREISGDGKAPFQAIKPFSIGIPELTPDGDSEGDDLSLIPYARQAFRGYRLLQEYFSFPQRFFFINIEGLNRFEASAEGFPFEVKISFDRKLSREYQPSINDILINCVPIINLFDRPTEEVAVTQRMPEYYVIPDADRRKSKEIYSINKVDGISENKLLQYSYSPVTSYDILDTTDPEYEYKRFFSAVYRPVPGDMGETAIRLAGPSMEKDIFPKETLSLQATLSNGFLPSKYLQVESISEPVNFPEGIKAANLTVPSEVLPSPERKNFLWALISHLTISFSTLADSGTFKSILNLYNWSPSHTNPNRKKIHEGIVRVHPPVTKNIYKDRGLIRGIEFTIDIDPRKFEHGEGDIHLFGLVLSRFLSQYLTINSFVILTFTDIETNKQYSWQPNPGKILHV